MMWREYSVVSELILEPILEIRGYLKQFLA